MQMEISNLLKKEASKAQHMLPARQPSRVEALVILHDTQLSHKCHVKGLTAAWDAQHHTVPGMLLTMVTPHTGNMMNMQCQQAQSWVSL